MSCKRGAVGEVKPAPCERAEGDREHDRIAAWRQGS